MRINTHDVPPAAGRTSERPVGRDWLMNRMFNPDRATAPTAVDGETDEQRRIMNTNVFIADVLQVAGLESKCVGRDLMAARMGRGVCKIRDVGEAVAEVEKLSAAAVEALQQELARLYANGPYSEPFPRFGVAGEGSSEAPMTFTERLFGRGSLGSADPRNMRRG